MSGSRKAPRTTSTPKAQFFLTVSVAALQLVVLPLPTFAQDGAEKSELASSDDYILEDVVVTARRHAESLAEAPVAVSAFTADVLQERQVFSTDALGEISPNTQFASYAPLTGNSSAAQVFIRGIGQTDATSSVDPGVGLYIDDVYMGTSVGGVLDFRDIKNVQVLRGPQGTLFGRNTIGGAVLITTQDPGQVVAGSTRFAVGSDALREFQGNIDVPLTETLLSRFTVGIRKRDGYVTRESDGVDLGDDNSVTATGKLTYAIDSFSFKLKADYTKEDENGSPLVFAAINEKAAFPAAVSVLSGCPGATMPPPYVPGGIVDSRCANNATWNKGPYKNAGTAPVGSTLDNGGLALVSNWELNDIVEFKLINSYRKTEWTGLRDADNTPLTILHTNMDTDGHEYSNELQLNVSKEQLNGIVGLYQYKSDYDQLLKVDITPPGAPRSVPINNGADLEASNWAIFTQWSDRFWEKVGLTAGARFTNEKKAATLDAFQSAPNDPATVVTRYVDQDRHENDFENFSVHLNAQYFWRDNVMTYMSYSEGFKSGGWNPLYNAVQANLLPTSFDEEQAKTYEIGIKSDVTKRLRVSAALFSTKYTDLQFTFRLGIVPLLFNAGEAQIDGGELEVNFIPTEKITLDASLGYLDASIDSVKNITSDAGIVTATVKKGNKLPYTPEWTASMGVGYNIDYTANWQGSTRLEISYTDAQFFDAANSVEIARDTSVTTARLSINANNSEGNWGLSLGVDNLTDKEYRVAGNSSLTTSSGYAESVYSRPRTVYGAVTYRFE